MTLTLGQNTSELIGKTPVLKINSLSRLTGCEIFLKCEFLNPGGSIKDRAAKQMVLDAIKEGKLKKGMSIVEGTAGNTGIGLAVMAKALGFEMTAVMPKGQTKEKERMIELFGGNLKLVDAVPFKNENHFYHTARIMGEKEPEKFWWANQFENLSNFKAHYEGTGPEIYQQMNQNLDAFVSVAGTGGTMGGNSAYLKEQNSNIEVVLVDPPGSGLKSYIDHGEFKSEGGSFTEGIGIMRLVENFKKSKVDRAISLPDEDIVTISRFVRDEDGILLGSSSALNVAGAFHTALKLGKGKRVITFACDLGERSASKLYNLEFLKEKGIDPHNQNMDDLLKKYRA